ncbi:PIN domain-containing protein [Streptomyces sp. NPDC002845]
MHVNTFVLDCEALSRAARRERKMTTRLTRAHRSGIRVVTSSMTLIEAYRGQVQHVAWAWAMSRIVVEPVTRDVAEKAIALLRDTGLHGHKYAIDAALAVIAGRLGGNVVLYTSDEDDMTKLCGETVRVVAL